MRELVDFCASLSISLYLREILGPKLIFICLRMSQEDRQERIRTRHKGDESAVALMDVIIQINFHWTFIDLN